MPNNNILIFTMLVITIVGIVIMKYVDRYFVGNPNRTVVNMCLFCMIINILIFVFLTRSFNQIKFAIGPKGPTGNRGEMGYIGNPDNCAKCGKQPNSVGHTATEKLKLDYIKPEKPILVKDKDPWETYWGKPVRIYKQVGTEKWGLVLSNPVKYNDTIQHWKLTFDKTGYADILILQKGKNNQVYIHNKSGKQCNDATDKCKIFTEKCSLVIDNKKFNDIDSTRSTYFDCSTEAVPTFIDGSPTAFSLSATDADNYTCYLDNSDNNSYFNCDHSGERKLSIEFVKNTYKPTPKPTPTEFTSTIYKKAIDVHSRIMDLLK